MTTETITRPDEVTGPAVEYDPEAVEREVARWIEARQGRG